MVGASATATSMSRHRPVLTQRRAIWVLTAGSRLLGGKLATVAATLMYGASVALENMHGCKGAQRQCLVMRCLGANRTACEPGTLRRLAAWKAFLLRLAGGEDSAAIALW